QRSARICFDELFALYRDLPSDYHVRASQIAYRLLVQVSVAHQGKPQMATLNPTVAAALRILETSGARDLDVRQVARTVGTSVSHLHRLFKDALGTSPLRYAREHIVAQAKDALGTTSLSCQEIAKRLGYDDPLYFSAVFKRIAGVSPREFRKRHR
ncbi:MAG TPA: AraC family transcriptional regulator, partial [Planctomycetota bacterium]|nr:AraC family transcriptional regulator [Planctomycetota bacterium]